MVSEDEIFDALAAIDIPRGMIEGIHIDQNGHVQLTMKVDPAQGTSLEPLRQKAEDTIATIENVAGAMVVLTAQKAQQKSNRTQSFDPHGMGKNPRLENLNVKNIIAIASGKGGVGKSTVAVNIARSLAQQNLKIGLLDADIYGPSVPKMMGLEAHKPDIIDGKLQPLLKDNLQIMSIGFLTDTSEALVWRGPMVQTALYQMLRDVAWGQAAAPLDYLIIDMPPGTGDAQLTLAQKVPVTGAIIVSTPQDIALIDARKAIEMFKKTDVPILGLIENMSVHMCSNCGHEEHIFGDSGAAKMAEDLGVALLGKIPLNIDIRLRSDAGKKIDTKIFNQIAQKLNSF